MRARHDKAGKVASSPVSPSSPMPVPAADWPRINALVTIAIPEASGAAGAGDWPERITRIEDVTDGRIAVAAPRGRTGELEPPADGEAFELHWPGPRGEFVLPVVLVERVRAAVDVWWLEPVGAHPQVHQRRNYVRAQATGWPARVGLTWMLPVEGTATGDLLELSEGGFRARVDGWEAQVGAALAVRLTLAEGVDDLAATTDVAGSAGPAGSGVAVFEYELMGTVLRVLPPSQPVPPGHEEAVDVVVQLHDAGRDGDALRAVVFSWQRQARRA